MWSSLPALLRSLAFCAACQLTENSCFSFGNTALRLVLSGFQKRRNTGPMNWNVQALNQSPLQKHMSPRWEANRKPAFGTADLKCICYTIRTLPLEWQTDCFIRTEAMRSNKFWNKKTHGWFCSCFQFGTLDLDLVSQHLVLRIKTFQDYSSNPIIIDWLSS